MTIVYDKKVSITCTHNDKVVEAEIDNFKKDESFDAFIATNKIRFRFNGKVYVGNALGMEFTTLGPKEFNLKQGRGL